MNRFFPFVVLTIALLTVPLAARANDAVMVGLPGQPQFLRGKHPTIRMVSETVDLTLNTPDSYTTDANFLFANDGSATVVQMGFPETGCGDISAFGKKSTFLSFATWVRWPPVQSDAAVDHRERGREWLGGVGQDSALCRACGAPSARTVRIDHRRLLRNPDAVDGLQLHRRQLEGRGG